jgi:hypothetical protein
LIEGRGYLPQKKIGRMLGIHHETVKSIFERKVDSEGDIGAVMKGGFVEAAVFGPHDCRTGWSELPHKCPISRGIVRSLQCVSAMAALDCVALGGGETQIELERNSNA